MEEVKVVRGNLLSVTQVAKKLNISKNSVTKLLKMKTFTWFPLLEGKYQIDSADVDDWLASIKIPAGKSLADHLIDINIQAEDELIKILKNLSKKGKLNFLLKIKEAV
jgi:transcriptional regulator with XRE-family HTH domain